MEEGLPLADLLEGFGVFNWGFIVLFPKMHLMAPNDFFLKQ